MWLRGHVAGFADAAAGLTAALQEDDASGPLVSDHAFRVGLGRVTALPNLGEVNTVSHQEEGGPRLCTRVSQLRRLNMIDTKSVRGWGGPRADSPTTSEHLPEALGCSKRRNSPTYNGARRNTVVSTSVGTYIPWAPPSHRARTHAHTPPLPLRSPPLRIRRNI